MIATLSITAAFFATLAIIALWEERIAASNARRLFLENNALRAKLLKIEREQEILRGHLSGLPSKHNT